MNPIRRANQFMKKYFPTLWLSFKVLAALIVVLIVLVLLASVVLDIYGSRKLNAVRREAAAKGLPLTMKDLLAKRPAVPEASNAANSYEAAFSLLAADSTEPVEKPIPLISKFLNSEHARVTSYGKAAYDDLRRIAMDRGEPFPPYVLEATREYVDQRRPAVDLICEAAALPQCAYHVNWLREPPAPPFFSKVLPASRLMCLAIWLDAEENRPADAVAKVRAAIALASSLSGEPDNACSVWLRQIAFHTAVDGLMRVVSRTNVTNEDLLLVEKDLERFAASAPLREVIEAELVSTTLVYASALDPESELRGTIEQTWNEPKRSLYRLFIPASLWLLRGAVKLDEAAAVRCHLVFLDNLDQPWVALMKAPDEIAGMVFTRRFSLAAAKPEALNFWLNRARLAVPQAEAAAASLAALRYRNDTGKWPETLDALVPAYLDEVPSEPFKNQPLIYTVLEDGIMIYSVGPNGRDDGGSPKLVESTSQVGGADDMGFRIWTNSEGKN